MHRWMVSIDYFFGATDYQKTLEYAYNDSIWLIDEAITCLTIFCILNRDWLKLAVVRIFIPVPAKLFPRMSNETLSWVWKMTSTCLREVDGKQFSFRLLSGNFLKNYMSSRNACVVRNSIFNSPKKNLSRTPLWKEEDKY